MLTQAWRRTINVPGCPAEDRWRTSGAIATNTGLCNRAEELTRHSVGVLDEFIGPEHRDNRHASPLRRLDKSVTLHRGEIRRDGLIDGLAAFQACAPGGPLRIGQYRMVHHVLHQAGK